MKKVAQCLLMIASIIALPFTTFAQSPDRVADALTVAITRLHDGREGPRKAISAPDSVLPAGVMMAAAAKLHVDVVNRDEHGTANVVYLIHRATLAPDTIQFRIRTIYHSDHIYTQVRTVTLAREQDKWVVKRVRMGAIS